MAHTFQGMLAALQAYWEEQGCTIMQPYHTEVGAGTSNPATFLRVLGAEAVAHGVRRAVDPARRRPLRREPVPVPAVLPVPGDPEAGARRHPGSVPRPRSQAIGIDVPRHDVRFVEDNWENPSLGASGLGWEVWMDGMEITQFTYFQQAGGFDLDPISVELAYGARAAGDVPAGRAPRAGHAVVAGRAAGPTCCFQNERQMSTYNYELADTAVHARHFDDFEAEARRCIEARLPLPAYDYVLKCSHAFNLLDARRAIAVTDRAGYILRMRRLSQAVAAHLPRGGGGRCLTSWSRSAARSCRRPRAARPRRSCPACSRRASRGPGIAAAERRVHVAPRRLAAIAPGLPAERPAERSEVRGPRADAPEQALRRVRAQARPRPGRTRAARRVRLGGLRGRGDAGRGARAATSSRRWSRGSSSRSRCAGRAAASRARCAGSS